jgi:hypothetical protein
MVSQPIAMERDIPSVPLSSASSRASGTQVVKISSSTAKLCREGKVLPHTWTGVAGERSWVNGPATGVKA